MGNSNTIKQLTLEDFKVRVKQDYLTGCRSREASLLGRKEVLTGKAKFGIFGDGKELAQLALAKCFKKGDFRSGYYRDQTLMFALGLVTTEQFFAQLYANPDENEDPHSAGRQMNAHFATHFLDEDGNWLSLKDLRNMAADASPTASQMPRSVGLALASKVYRQNNKLSTNSKFTNKGNEVVFATIGDASTSEGIFWESVNAAGVLKIPLAFFIWDDGYGISVPREYQTTKGSISTLLEGFRVDEKGRGFDIYTVKGWDYSALCEVFEKGIDKVRETHIPAIFHVKEVTQPQGHSTSGSHERYKSAERLQWEKDFDCLLKMREWLIANALATESELDTLENQAKEEVKSSQKLAWANFNNVIKSEVSEVSSIFTELAQQSTAGAEIAKIGAELQKIRDVLRRDVFKAVKQVLRLTHTENLTPRPKLINWLNREKVLNYDRYSSHLYSQTALSALKVPEVKAVYSDNSQLVNGFEVLNACFDALLARTPEMLAFGEDLGKIGDVNQGFAGLQEKYGEQRVFDTGIREATIIGQGIGLAMRGLRPIAEIQYLDYLIYGLQPLTDDLATLLYRTKGRQKAPLIIRTRGHRLEGIWHTGSPIGMVINSLRGINVLVPRNMVQAAGFYNLMFQSDEPALIIECLNGYRLKERLPENIAEFTVPLGVPEILNQGEDITLVTYGSCCRIAEEAIRQLEKLDISVELIDVQTLLPFDIHQSIVESVKKTNRLVVLDEDVPGGASAYIMKTILEDQGAYFYLDSSPLTITAHPHRAAYGSDGDYFSKPNAEDITEKIYALMNESDPLSWPELY